LIPALRAMGIAKLDGLILTHDDSDHTGGAASVMQAMPIDWLLSSLPDGHVLLQHATHPQRCADGQHWDWDGVGFEILHPDIASYNDETIRDNDRGCVLRISIGEQRILLTADIEKKSEARLINEHADKLFTTLLVVPHHGSKTSSTLEFITATCPTTPCLPSATATVLAILNRKSCNAMPTAAQNCSAPIKTVQFW